VRKYVLVDHGSISKEFSVQELISEVDLTDEELEEVLDLEVDVEKHLEDNLVIVRKS